MHTLDDSRWMAFRNKGRCWGGGVGREMVSYELQKVGPPTVMRTTRDHQTKAPRESSAPLTIQDKLIAVLVVYLVHLSFEREIQYTMRNGEHSQLTN